jgi:hypothetical protein
MAMETITPIAGDSLGLINGGNATGAIKGIVEEGITQTSHVNTNLVGATGKDFHF